MAADRRMKRTEKALKTSFIELLKKKPRSKITVKEVTDLADINRGTFYLHYTDIFHLYCSIKNDFLEMFIETVKAPTETPYEFFLKLFQFLDECTELFLLLNQDSSFTEQIINVLKNQYLESWMQRFSNSNPMHYEYFYCFATEGSIGVIKQWCSRENRESPEVMARILAKFAESGFSLLMNQNEG
jgi:AcrR family transcriptional regulator